MRPFLLALPALLALSAAAAAGPQPLDEGRLAAVAAGQELVPSSSFSLLNNQPVTTTNTSTSTFSAMQGLTGSSTNAVNAIGLGSMGISAMGSASSMVSGAIGAP